MSEITKQSFSEHDNLKIRMQNFQERLNKEPNPAEFEPTPDGKARTLPISFVEMTLDEMYLGQWESSDATYSQIFNEVVAVVTLTVWHPITNRPLKRSGWASVIITQDKDATIAEFNMTKKKNALDLAFPKLGAEALKNAAKSLGKIFGRDINRKKQDVFKPPLRPIPDTAMSALLKRIEAGETHLAIVASENFLLDELQTEILTNAVQQKQLGNGTR